MSIRDQTSLLVIVYEGKAAQPLTPTERFDLIAPLLAKGYSVLRTNDDTIAFSPNGRTVMLVGRFDGCHVPRELEAAAGARIHLHNLAEHDAAQVPVAAEAIRQTVAAPQPGQWLPWFPVIDYDRCTNCMQCLSFCLFGVYGVDAEQRITVQSSESCKTNCPACSRVCPEAAIMFPKYKAGPINGDTVSDADLQREKMKIDISALLGGDVYALLRQRSERAKSRFSKERDSDKALQERLRCLKQLQEAVEIPPEVLMALPSPDEIRRRAEEAKARAEAALAQQPKS